KGYGMLTCGIMVRFAARGEGPHLGVKTDQLPFRRKDQGLVPYASVARTHGSAGNDVTLELPARPDEERFSRPAVRLCDRVRVHAKPGSEHLRQDNQRAWRDLRAA